MLVSTYYAHRFQRRRKQTVVGVAQLVELRIVIPAVVGSNPIVHPNLFTYNGVDTASQRSSSLG